MIPITIIIGVVLVAAVVIAVIGFFVFRDSDKIEEDGAAFAGRGTPFTANRTGHHRMILPTSKMIGGKQPYESTYRSVPSTDYFAGQQIGLDPYPSRVPMGIRTIRDRTDSTFFRPSQTRESVLDTN